MQASELTVPTVVPSMLPGMFIGELLHCEMVTFCLLLPIAPQFAELEPPGRSTS